MEYLGFIFGIFGLIAHGEVLGLKNRIIALENQMAKTEGTTYHEERISLITAIKSYIGKAVIIEQYEDYADPDIISCGNSKYGSTTVLDADDDWIMISIESKKGKKLKLIRPGSVSSISLKEEKDDQ